MIVTLNKRFPFTISRGTRTYSKNIFVELREGIHDGIGECDPGTSDTDEEVLRCKSELDAYLDSLDVNNMSIQEIWRHGHAAGLQKPLQAALDIALWDLLGKCAGLPCYRLFGLSPISPPTSITLGITPLEEIPSRIEALLANKFHSLKIKLGAPDGVARDQEAFMLIKKAAAPFDVALRVDANGGWSLSDAKVMCAWLAARGVEYVEQPLHADDIDALPHLFKDRPLPIFVDESCHISADVVRVAPFVDGVNIKLMKCGGITEALRMVAVARAHGLKTMIGCMSESSVAIAAGASIGALFDHIDLDSCFNLDPDPAMGLMLEHGVVTPSARPGHGACL
jgi:muconate cycloisomerase